MASQQNLRAPSLPNVLLDRGSVWSITLTFPENYPSLVGVTATSSVKLNGVGSSIGSLVCVVDTDARTVQITLTSTVSLLLEAGKEYEADLKLSWSSTEVRYPVRWKMVTRDPIT